MRLQPSSRLGPYQILGPLAAGGMGEVYRARDSKLEREVAIKVLPERVAADPEALSRFEREAKAVAALSHPNILAIHDFGTEDGTAYAVMELLEGETLRERLAAGPLPPRKAAEWGMQIANALAAAHDRGIVHRDLKPENVFVTHAGHVKLLDFGLALQQDVQQAADQNASPTRTRHTDPGTVLGTAGYMSPEQVRGKLADHRSDIFSLGVVLYEMLSGRRAFHRETSVETMNAILKEEPRPLSEPAGSLSPDLERIVQHCLEKRPEERFQSARDLAFDLGHATGESGRSAPTAATSNTRSGLRRLAAAALGLVALALAFAGGFSRGRSVQDSAPLPESYTQVTDQPGVESNPSLSPDGKSIVYVSRATGNDDIYLQRVGAGVAINLTADSPNDDTMPSFSPDGEQIAFVSNRAGAGVFVMGVTGESVRRVTDFGNDPSWSPDGKEIVVSTVRFEDPYNRLGRGELWAVDVVSGSKRPVVKVEDAVQATWSPHGKRIAYWGLKASAGSQRDLFTVAADGSDATRGTAVTNDLAVDWNPVWSPDGRYLFFSSDRGGTMNLWRVRIEEDTGRTLADPEPVTTPSAWAGSLAFSRDGRRLAFATLEWRSTLLKTGFDPVTGTIQGLPERLVSSTQPIRDHEVSPDGNWVVYSRTGVREDIFVARTDGTSYRRLTDDLFRDRGSVWSPDGQRIVFYSDRGGKYDLWTIRPDGSGLQQLTRSPYSLNFPTWAPDGLRLAVATPRTDGWFLVDPAANPGANVEGPMPAMPNGLYFYPLSWSRDGASLLGRRVDGATRILGLSRYWVASHRYEDVYDNPSLRLVNVTFMKDGRRAVVRNPDGILLLDLQTRQRRHLLTLPGQITGRSVALARDNRSITYTETAAEGNIWLLSFRE